MSTEQLKPVPSKDPELQKTQRSRAASYSYDTDISSSNTPIYPSFNEVFNSPKGEGDLFSSIRSSFRDENEDIIIQLSKRQRKMSNYSDEENLAYSSRETVLEWCNKVLDSIELTLLEKESIFHRFSTAFDFVMEKLSLIHKAITDPLDLKKLVVTIFLLTYKLEGFSIGKITINTLIDAFLKSLKINKEELSKQIVETELKILNILDYNPLILDDNVHQLSFILYDLLKIKIMENKMNSDISKKIEGDLIEMNKIVQFSDKLLFDILPIDKAAISFFSVLECNKKSVDVNIIEKFYNYLRNELKVLKIEDETFWNLCVDFSEQLYIDEFNHGN